MAAKRSRKKTTLDDLARALSGGTLLPVYVLAGAEAFLRHRGRRMIRQAVVDREGGSVNVFDSDDALETVLSELRGDSLFASRRMIELIGADKFLKQHADALARYLERPSTSAVLVVDAEKVDRRTKFVSTASQAGMLIECDPMYEDRLPRWVVAEGKSRGVRISSAAAAALVDEVGKNLFALSTELDKLITYIGGRKTIEPGDVADIVGRSRSWEVWGLTDAMGRRRVAEALKIFERLLEDGEKVVMIIGTLNWQIRRIWEARRLLDAGASDRELMSKLRMNPYFLGPLKEQAQQFDEVELARLSRMLLEVDMATKSTSAPEKLLVERFLVGACTPGARTRVPAQ